MSLFLASNFWDYRESSSILELRDRPSSSTFPKIRGYAFLRVATSWPLWDPWTTHSEHIGVQRQSKQK